MVKDMMHEYFFILTLIMFYNIHGGRRTEVEKLVLRTHDVN